ncbi:MAG: butyrate kinase [Blautia sp.]
MSFKQLIINPGSTSTKLALYEDRECVVQENVEHAAEELAAFEKIPDQIPYRMNIIRDFMKKNGIKGETLSAIMGRGGLVPGLHTGGYRMNDSLFYALENDRISSPHASNLGGMLAKLIGDAYEKPAYIYDAVTSSELPPVAQVTGIPKITRQSFCHVLNSRAMALRYAKENGLDYKKLNLIVAHLGGGISASVHSQGKIIDSLGDDDGQFSPERAGSVPSLELIRLCYSGDYTRNDMKKMVRGKGGMYAHLGTSDCREIEKMILAGDRHADLVFQAQAYQISKGIGLLSIVLKGNCDAIILTGGVANSRMLTKRVEEYVKFIAPVVVMPGENEMEALAFGGLRILNGTEEVHTYELPSIQKEHTYSRWKPSLP